MKPPQHIIFDLDHTLWDFDANARDTLVSLVADFRGYIGEELDFEAFFQVYQGINQELWKLYRTNQVDITHVRTTRFVEAFGRFGIPKADWMDDFGKQYVAICPTKGKVIAHAIETLDYLSAKNYRLQLITNGIKAPQLIKLNSSGLAKYFDLVVTSDLAGAKKPDPRIFQYTLDRLAIKQPDQVVYIGDNYEADVMGGLEAGIPVIFFNPHRNENPLQVPEIERLSDLMAIF